MRLCRGRPFEFYQKAQQYLADNDLQSTGQFPRDYILGDVFSAFWPMIMGEPADHALQDDCQTFRCQPQRRER